MWAEPLRSEVSTSAPPLNQHPLGLLTPQLPAEVGKPGDYGEWLHSRARVSVGRQGESPHHYSGRCSFCESDNLSLYSNLSSKKGQRVPGKESQARVATGVRTGLFVWCPQAATPLCCPPYGCESDTASCVGKENAEKRVSGDWETRRGLTGLE